MQPTREPAHLICGNRFEQEIRREGYSRIAGVDEVGRGALCGPVVAAAVILDLSRVPAGVDDSKKLSANQREELFAEIMKSAQAIGVGRIEPDAIDQENILKATLRAMALALEQLHPSPDYLLLDAVELKAVDLPQRSIVKGDAQSVSIAAASIIAKVTRDRIMVELGERYPQYALSRNKGYGTREHLESLRRFGPSPIHRRTFRPVYQLDFAFERSGTQSTKGTEEKLR